jgi:hypothetical protein
MEERLGERLAMAQWAIDEAEPRTPTPVVLLEEVRRGAVRREPSSPRLALRLLEVVVHHNRKLFGEAPVRIDALVVHGGGAERNSLVDFYAPGTFRFDRVADGDRLPIGDSGLLVFLGKPRYFIDLFLAVSRDRKGSESLHSLLGELAASKEGIAAQGKLLAMALGTPDPALLSGALKAALMVGDAALISLRKATSGTIGLYRNSWLRGRDGWGIGLHPPTGLLRAKDLSFSFEIVREPN